MSSRRPYLEDPAGIVCISNPFLFMQSRTLLQPWGLPTLFSSITSALFPVQRRGRVAAGSRTHAFCPFCPCLSSLFSCKYELPNLQALCFDNVATVGGMGVAYPNSYHSGGTSYFQLNVFVKTTRIAEPGGALQR